MKENEERFFEYYNLVFRSINTPVKLKIIEILQKQSLNVSEINERFDISMSNLSNNLNSLRYGYSEERTEEIISIIFLSIMSSLMLKKMKEIIKFITFERNKILNLNKIK